jgi:hypothetical protein
LLALRASLVFKELPEQLVLEKLAQLVLELLARLVFKEIPEQLASAVPLAHEMEFHTFLAQQPQQDLLLLGKLGPIAQQLVALQRFILMILM